MPYGPKGKAISRFCERKMASPVHDLRDYLDAGFVFAGNLPSMSPK